MIAMGQGMHKCVDKPQPYIDTNTRRIGESESHFLMPERHIVMETIASEAGRLCANSRRSRRMMLVTVTEVVEAGSAVP